jgi:hypothetical protein
MGETINSYNVLVEKLEEQKQFGRPGHRFKGSIKIDL